MSTDERRRLPGSGAAPRWAGVALAAYPAWLAAAGVNRLATGSFWFLGLPDPLLVLLFLLGPLAVLTAVPWLLLARARLARPDRLLVSLAVAVLALICLHRLLSGRSWLWVLPALLPPPLPFLLMPLALLVAVGVRRSVRTRSARTANWSVVALVLVALTAGVGQSGLNLRAVTGGGDGPAPPGALRVMVWDTLQWTRGIGAERLYRYLRARPADVYVLQDYAQGDLAHLRPDEDADLRRAFPGFHFASVGDLLTVSRFPIVAQVPLETNPRPPAGTENIDFLKSWRYGALRTDLAVAGTVLSVYNVHFYDGFAFGVSPATPRFYRNVRGLAAGRRSQFDQVRADIDGNPHPVLVAGNLNTPPSEGHMLRRLGRLEDAGRAAGALYPTTYRLAGVRLWKLDWAFVTPDVRVHDYAVRDSQGLSTHSPQYVLVSLDD